MPSNLYARTQSCHFRSVAPGFTRRRGVLRDAVCDMQGADARRVAFFEMGPGETFL